MYQDKFVVAIKVGGKILRETKDLVHLPFGSEFSVLVKNLNSRRAKFTLHIDGTDVLDGTEIIVNANSEVEMKRFIRNGNMDEGNAFKFIERTQAIEDGPRGIKMDDGVVRVQFWFEKEVPITTYHRNVWWDDYYNGYPYRRSILGPYYGSHTVSSIASDTSPLYNATSEVKLKSANVRSMAVGQNAVFTANASLASDAAGGSASLSAEPEVTNDVGITVPGSKVEQKFETVYGFNAEPNSYTIVLRMAGTKGKVEVAAPVTVKTKNICSTCSHTNKAKAKFCSECGTSLILV